MLPPRAAVLCRACYFASVVTGTATCQPRATSPSPAPVTSAPAPAPDTPSAAECGTLWADYHAQVPNDPYVDRAAFVARCTHSTRAVLGCNQRARAELREMAQRVFALVDAGPAELPPTELLLRIGMPSRVGVCITRERARRARDIGELAELARDVSEGRLRPDERGVLVVEGEHATLPWRGVVEDATSANLGPPGEVRVLRKPDGRVWIYLLGGMLGRHQNQVGFLYSSRPFVPRDSEADGEGGERVCLEPDPDEGAAAPRRRYLLSCFTVIHRLAPELLEVGSAPD